MRIEFDSDKDSGNQAKHGVSLALAAELDWEAALVGPSSFSVDCNIHNHLR